MVSQSQCINIKFLRIYHTTVIIRLNAINIMESTIQTQIASIISDCWKHYSTITIQWNIIITPLPSVPLKGHLYSPSLRPYYTHIPIETVNSLVKHLKLHPLIHDVKYVKGFVNIFLQNTNGILAPIIKINEAIKYVSVSSIISYPLLA